jgi:hypothetical protein
MYIEIGRSGSVDSRQISWAMTSLAAASSIRVPRKTMRPSNSLL